ncbi:aldehyde dehydrogenase [Mycolicibacterium celeriflavum]|uniref:aldehyde dehydrogenase (NAD(+)) n=1 Tax=Mycolicibacterium celeriflavum TaxID=1249101 RepID=A0A1X0BM79_MYCCF|nr:aldehyde dehydrogenase [Mycolicibacterium celeriflavum]MCV7240091.1 aldehyde dehydrogenase [Mycolicibacterium celeriflavum]ORA43615.1 aldehyde dehydrogenase [Mycolicibacterium celeriflavum]BBY46525.1 aldehyde dehydrogenase [Mycolicibacterium celeriflavum]
MHSNELFIGGRWLQASTGQRIEVVAPHTEEPLAKVAAAGQDDVDNAVAAARSALDSGPWPRLQPAERIAAVRGLAALYGERRAEMAELITSEIGAPISFAQRAQVGLPAMMMTAFCDLAGAYPWREVRAGMYGADIHIRREPVGVVAAVVPWNMPQFLIVTKLIPALLAGCSVVLKPAPESPLNALLLAEMIAESDLPPGVVSVLPGDGSVGEYLVKHPGVDKVSFTGSTAAGRAVAAACAADLKRVSLELGGKSAAIVLDDADPATVATGVRSASLSNSGQICNALTRVLVPTGRADEFTDALAAEMASLVVGDPTEPATQVGPLVAQRQQERVRGYIDAGQAEGARLVTGGTAMPDGIDKGWYVRPTLFADATNSMRIAREEIFGPVLTVIPYSDEDEAVAIANDSDYGLAGSVFTEDTERGLDVAARIHTGSFGVNQGYTMDPFAPFGGVKGSGYGRELGREGIDGYTDTKSISVAAKPDTAAASVAKGA